MNQRIKRLDNEEEQIIRKIQPYMEAYEKQRQHDHGFLISLKQQNAPTNIRVTHNNKKNKRIYSASQANLQNNLFSLDNNFMEKMESQSSTKCSTRQQKNTNKSLKQIHNRKYVYKKYQNKLKEKENSINQVQHSFTTSEKESDDQKQIQMFFKKKQEEDRIRDQLYQKSQLMERQERINQIKEIEKKSEKEALYLKQLQKQQKLELEQLKEITKSYFEKLQYLEQQIISKTESEKNSIKSHETKTSKIPQESNIQSPQSYVLSNNKSTLRKIIRNEAATVIQKNWKCFIAQKKYRNRQLIQSQIKSQIKGKKLIQSNAVIDIQKNWRKYISVKKFKKRILIKHKEGIRREKEFIKNKKATMIQSQWRGYIARKNYLNKKIYKSIKEKELIRKQLKEQKSIIIQKNWRGFAVRSNQKKVKQHQLKLKQQQLQFKEEKQTPDFINKCKLTQENKKSQNEEIIQFQSDSNNDQSEQQQLIEEGENTKSSGEQSFFETINQEPELIKTLTVDQMLIEILLLGKNQLLFKGPQNCISMVMNSNESFTQFIDNEIYIFTIKDQIFVHEKSKIKKIVNNLTSIYLLYTYLRQFEIEKENIKAQVQIGRYRKRLSYLRIINGNEIQFLNLKNKQYQQIKSKLNQKLSVSDGKMIYGKCFKINNEKGDSKNIIQLDEKTVQYENQLIEIADSHNLQYSFILNNKLKVYTDKELENIYKIIRIIQTPKLKKAVRLRYPTYRKNQLLFDEYGTLGVCKKGNSYFLQLQQNNSVIQEDKIQNKQSLKKILQRLNVIAALYVHLVDGELQLDDFM